MNFQLLFAHFSALSVLIPLTLAFLQWRRLSRQLKVISLVLVFSAFTDAISFIFINYSISTFILFNILCLIQLTLFLYAFSLSSSNKALLVVIYSIFVIVYVINFFRIDDPAVFDSASNATSSIILIILSIQYLYRLLNELREPHIYRLPMLWITFGIFAYNAGTLFLILATNYLLASQKESYGNLWILNSVMNITLNILFAIGLWQNYKTVHQSHG